MTQAWPRELYIEVNPDFILLEVHQPNALGQWFSDFSMWQNQGLLKQSAGPLLQVADPVCLGWGLRMCTSNKLLGGATDYGCRST